MKIILLSFSIPLFLQSCESTKPSFQRPLMDDIKEAYQAFASGKGENFFADGSVKYMSFQDNNGVARHFYGVHKDTLNRDTFPYDQFKAKVREKMGISGKKLFQIIGTVKPPFEQEAGEYARNWFYTKIKSADIIEYGVTSGGKIEEPTVNAFVSYGMEIGKIDPSIVLGNVVGDSVYMVEKYKANFSPKIIHLVLVYNETLPIKDTHGNYSKNRTIFGDDVNISDRIMSSNDGDEMILIDGGVQSLQQSVTALTLGVKVSAIYGIKVSKDYLSAAEFLAGLKSQLQKTPGWTIQTAKDFYADYMKKRKGWDDNAPDAHTKQALLERIQGEFFKEEPLKNLLLHFEGLDYETL